uniref:Uncharacterized protein n=1 Tax=Plectus sambesii TaxID=2011161 RepID=A0A914X4E0_9BILA
MCKSLPNVGYSNAVTNSSLVKTLPFEKTSISHVCSAGYSFPDGSTEKFYVCLSNGTWSNVGDSCQIATTTTTLATTSMARSTSTASTPAATFMASTTTVTTTKATTKTTTTEATTPSTTTAPPVIVDCYHNDTCQNDGQCEGLIDASHCVCTDGYTGATCQQIKYNPCSSSPCAGIHNVECVRQSDTAFACQCKAGFAQTDSCRADSSCSDCDVPLCEWPPVDMKNSYIYNETDPGVAVGLTSKYREAGTVVVHKCNANNSFPDGSTPPRTYTCTNDHSWINVNGPCNEPECPKNNQLVCSDASCVCIFLPSEPSAWDQLRTMCADSGSMLPVLSNQFKWSEFQKVRPPTANYENVWIGLHIIGTVAGGGGNAYEWADNSTFKVGDFAPWAPGQPNTESDTAYCVVSSADDNYLWSMHDCSDYSIYGICFVPPPPPPTCVPPTVDMSHSTTESNVSSVTGSVIWGTTTIHNCMDGYAFDNYQTKRTYQCWKNSTWLYEKGPCIRLCKSLPMVDFSNADTNCTTIKSLPFEGTTVYHHCSDGFTFPDGSKDRTYACQSNGTWSNVDGACAEAITTTVTTTTQLAATAAATTTVAKPSTSSTTTSTTTRTTTVKTTTTKPPTTTATTTTKAAATTTTKAAATTTSTKAPQTPAPTTPYLPPPTTTTTAAPVHVDCYHNVKCENGGTCEGLFDNSYCTCTADFTGTLCTEPYIDPCASNPCTARHVVCVRQSNTAFSCQCAAGWGRTEACSAVSTCSDCDIPLCNWPPVDLKNSAIYNQTHTGPYIVTGLTSINRENGTVVVHKCNPNNAFPDGTTGARTYVCTNDHTWMNVDGPCNPPICPPSSDPDCSGAQCVCLQIPGDPSAWDEASANCKAGGSMLAILDTSHEWSEFLKLRVNYDYLNKAWIGLHIVGATTQGAPVYEWADGKPFNPSTDFAPWAPGEPKTANGKCVASLLTPDNFLWTLHDCSDYDNYGICYIPPLPPPQCDPPVVNMQFSTPESNASSLTDKVIWGTELIHN